MSLFNDDDEEVFESDIDLTSKGYTTKVAIPQYEPSNVCPTFGDMMNTTKYEELVNRINASDVPDEIKRFLRLCATRHIAFNYSKVADYYAHSSKEVQELLEDSAMVIIDINNAIADGFVKLDERLLKIATAAYEANKEK